MAREGSVFEGKTLDDAVRKGMEALGLARAEVIITVEEEGSGGFLGLGARPYRVRIMPRPGGAIPEAGGDEGARRGRDARRGPRTERGPRDARGPRREGGRDRGRGGQRTEGGGRGRDRGHTAPAGETVVPREGRESGRGDTVRGEGRTGRDRGEGSRSGGEPAEVNRGGAERTGGEDRGDSGRGSDRGEAGRGGEHGEDRGGDRGGDRGRRRRRGGRSDHEGSRAPAGERRPQAPGPRREPSEPRSSNPGRESAAGTLEPEGPSIPPAELAAEGKRWTEDLLRHMGFEGNVKATAEEDRVDVVVELTSGEELLTGRKGEVRQALQHLLNLMINHGGRSRYHLQLEINEFWQRREIELQELARELAEEALSNGREAVTEYLNAQERRVIHMALKEDGRVKTYALGTGLIKRVAVAPADFAGEARD